MYEPARLHFTLYLFVAFKAVKPLIVGQAVLIRIITCMALIAFTAYNGLMKELTLRRLERSMAFLTDAPDRKSRGEGKR